MNRRKFIGSVAGASAFLLNKCSSSSPERTKEAPGASTPVSPDGKLAGKTYEELLKEYKSYIFDDFFPFVEKYAVDPEFGGFMCNTDVHGKNITTNKTAWYEGRGTWSFSFLYNTLKKDPKYRDIGRKSVEFTLKTAPQGDGFWPGSFSREGKPIEQPAPNFYGDLFIASGFQEYAEASGEEKYWNLAKELMFKCLKRYDSPDYFPEAGMSYLGEGATPTPGARIGGHWFMLVNLASLMLEQRHDPEIVAVADRCLDAVVNYHYNPDFGLLNELINHDLSRPQNELAQFVYLGHNVETLWMCLYEVARRKDKTLFEKVAAMFKRNLEVAWDDVYGGVLMDLRHVDNNVWGPTRKSNWAQGETLIGLMLILEHTGAPWAAEWFGRVFNYMTEKFPLKKYGYPLWIDYADRKVTFVEKDFNRVEVLHHPRHLMMNAGALERIIARKGNISGQLA